MKLDIKDIFKACQFITCLSISVLIIFLSVTIDNPLQFPNVLAQNTSVNIFNAGNQGIALNNVGNYTEAIAYFDKVLATDPTDTDTLNEKSMALAKLR